MPANDRIYSPEELAEYLQVPVRTLYYWRERKTGPKAAAIGKHLRYRASDVDRWLEERTSDPKSVA